MSVIFLDENSKNRFDIDRTPHEYLDFLYEQTDEDGILIIPQYKFDPETNKWHFGYFEMDWTREDVDRLHEEYDEYVGKIEKAFAERSGFGELVNDDGLVADQTSKILTYMTFGAPEAVIEAEKYFLIQDMAIEKYSVILDSNEEDYDDESY